jgi:protein-S-isoprenylcysteine O-methyltransferase Ste14
VHLGLLATAIVSLVFEPVLTIHVLLGLAFVALVVVHLGQRRRVSRTLLARFARPRQLPNKGGRLALADAFLALLTLAMLASGLWDWLAEPTRIRWHAITGVLLAGLVGVHTLRRWRRFGRSRVR